MDPYGEGGNENTAEDEEEAELPTMHKIAILMVSLGEDVSGEVMKHLSDFEIEEITQAIASLKNVPTDLMDSILQEFEQHLMVGEWVSSGGVDFARTALERAVGPRKAQEILNRVSTRVTLGLLHAQKRGARPDRPVHLQRAPPDHRSDPLAAGPGPGCRHPGATARAPAGGCGLPGGDHGEHHAQCDQGDRGEPGAVAARHSGGQPGCGRPQGGGRHAQL